YQTAGGMGQTLAGIAATLASMINADDLHGLRYTAIAVGTKLFIVDRKGGSFETRLETGLVTRAEGYAEVEMAYGLSATDFETRLKALYGFDGIKVESSVENGATTYTITFVRQQAGIDYQQIEL